MVRYEINTSGPHSQCDSAVIIAITDKCGMVLTAIKHSQCDSAVIITKQPSVAWY